MFRGDAYSKHLRQSLRKLKVNYRMARKLDLYNANNDGDSGMYDHAHYLRGCIDLTQAALNDYINFKNSRPR